LQTLQAAPRQVLSVMQAPARDLLYLLKNYEQKLADSGTNE
jgi:ribosomal protein L10